MFTAWVIDMFTFRENGYTIAMAFAFATKIVEIWWLQLTKTGFLMYARSVAARFNSTVKLDLAAM
jgi:hypothetical protein